MCYYSQSAVHPLKFSPCWTFGIPVLSVFKLLKFLLLFIYSFESLNFTSLPLVLFSCSRPSLSFSLSFLIIFFENLKHNPDLSLLSICTWLPDSNQILNWFWTPELYSFYYQLVIAMWMWHIFVPWKTSFSH